MKETELFGVSEAEYKSIHKISHLQYLEGMQVLESDMLDKIIALRENYCLLYTSPSQRDRG